MLKKTISSLMTLLAALLLASCAPSHSTNNQTTASSAEVAKKNEISITISVTPEGQKVQSKTLKVAEESNLMKVLKANYKIEEKNGMITSIDG
ncbi:MAG: cobalamin ECF transporter, partial [Streptococcus parasanguinis]|nr:cobalamin ECF transporter [Streptococcus parasanguinis]